MTAESLDKLLEVLSHDRNPAAYSELRDSLVRFFQLKGDDSPDAAADETLDRVAAKLAESITVEDIKKYTFGVARFIYLERLRREQRRRQAVKEYYAKNIERNDGEEKDGFAGLRECFNLLADEDKNLLKTYFADLPPDELTARRQRLIEKENITLNKLRLKIYRLRRRLDDCVREKK